MLLTLLLEEWKAFKLCRWPCWFCWLAVTISALNQKVWCVQGLFSVLAHHWPWYSGLITAHIIAAANSKYLTCFCYTKIWNLLGKDLTNIAVFVAFVFFFCLPPHLFCAEFFLVIYLITYGNSWQKYVMCEIFQCWVILGRIAQDQFHCR